MRRSYGEDLGLGTATAVAAFLFVPLFVVVVRRKWRMSVARSEEVRRLVAMASEEAAMAEIEWAFQYTSEKAMPGVSVGGGSADGALRLCAVCYSPTTTRCSRCKAVRYCSGKCQIIHWRQGHKDECYPQCNPAGAFSDRRVSSAADSKLSGDVSENLTCKPLESNVGHHTGSSSICSTSVVHNENDAISNPVNKFGSEGNYCPTTLPSSGCSTFAPVSECLDAAPESVKCHHCDIIDTENSSSDTSSCDTSHMDLPPETATAAVPLNRVLSLDKLNNQMIGCTTEKLACEVDVNSRRFGSGDSADTSCTVHQEITGKTALNSSDNIDISKSASSKKDFGKLGLHFNLPDVAASSQSSSECRLHPGVDVSSKSISYSRAKHPYLDESISGINEKKNTESLMKHRQSKSQTNDVSGFICGNSGGNDMSESKSLNHLSSPTIASRNNISASNGGHALKSVRKAVQQLKPSKPSKLYKILRPYDLYIKLYNEKVDLQPCGLINCGNSCYANAVLQCLTFTQPLAAYLLQGFHSKMCPKKEWCFTCEFEHLVVNLKQGKSPKSPIGILSHIHNLGSSLGHGKQEDAHEFLRYAIDAMQAMCPKESQNPAGQLLDESTFIQLIFGGYLRSKIRCMRCKSVSERCERMMDLTVEIHGDGDIRTLEEALARFTATEILDGENKYRCSRCKSYEKAKKKLSVLEAPNVLTIALKRFQSGKFGKLNKMVQFPEFLNMSKYMCSGSHDKGTVYRLYAVVVHVDIMNAAFSGHYMCYVKNLQDKWYKLDDSTVKPVELDRVLSKGAYMLLYARISPRQPSFIRKEIPCGPTHSKSRKLHGSIPSGNREDCFLGRRSNPDCLAEKAAFSNWSDPHIGRFILPYQIKVDSSSDSSGLSFSDEGSCSTESTRDSTSTDDYSEHLFEESYSFNRYSPSRVSEDSDGFITCSPSYLRNTSDGSISMGRMSDFLIGSNSASDLSSLDEEDARQTGDTSYTGASGLQSVGTWNQHDSRRVFSQGKENSPFLPSDITRQCRKLTEQRSSGKTNRDTHTPKSGLFMRTRSGSAQTRQ